MAQRTGPSLKTGVLVTCLLLGAVLALGGFAPAGALEENEPNDNATTAQPLEANTSVSGAITTLTDEDWFEIEGERGDFLVVTVEASGNTDPISVSLRRPGGSVLDGESVAGGQTARLEYSVESTGQFYVVVDGIYTNLSNGGYTGRAGGYTVRVESARPVDADLEPNDSPASATPLPSEETITGTTATLGDTDWYAVTVPAGAQPNITLSTEVGSVNAVLWVGTPGPNGTRLTPVDAAVATAGETAFVAGTARDQQRTYYVEVSGFFVESTLNRYTLTVEDTLGPSDGIAEAGDPDH